MIFCLFIHVLRLVRPLGMGLLLAVCAAPTLAENAAPGKPDAAGALNGPHIGLVLPLNAQAFRQPAEAVKQGVLAAAKAQPGMPMVRVYPTTDQVANVLAVYQQAVDGGARVIIGPLTKSAVAALAESDITAVPTLALSVPEGEVISPNLYLFGLSLDAEARQVAQLAASEGRNSVLIVAASNAPGKRLQASFIDEWLRLGGKIVGQLSFTPSTDLNTLHGKLDKLQPESIFLAVNAQEARLVRPYLSTATPIPTYATSQAFGGAGDAQKNIDLAGVRFLDMPWMLQPDHPAVMIYPHPEKALSIDGERLYAMGIDAYRLAQLFYRGEMPTRGVVLDGVTGQISLAAGRQFMRELTAAEFQADVVVVIDNAKP
ncbi:MAG: penicillin-binding protein activator [Hydrogenophilales bacterium]|nr:penicillin-binding protein activator [Hydrogenophilales bacterium]